MLNCIIFKIEEKIKMNGQTKFIFDKIVFNPNVRSILNIGYRHTSDPTIKNACEMLNKRFTILEVFHENCEYMRNLGMEVIEMDIRNIKNLNRTFDAVIWLHGPEHISWDDFLSCRHDIESKSRNITIYQAPIGEYIQDELYGNPYEKHISTLTGSMFKELGYEVVDHDQNGEFTFSAWITK